MTATNLAIVAGGLGSLVNNGNGTWNYTPAAGDSSAVSFSYLVTDSLASVAGSASMDITPSVANVINGTAGNDSLVGTAGVDTINGLAGNDTIGGGLGADT